MKVYRIKISSWTSSFRYPNIISGFQPTLLVPPISTVLGILNACAGKYIIHNELLLGYYFEYGGKSVDLETIQKADQSGAAFFRWLYIAGRSDRCRGCHFTGI